MTQLEEPTFDSEQLKPGQKVVFYCGDFNKNGRRGDLYLKVKAYKNGKLIAVSYDSFNSITLKMILLIVLLIIYSNPVLTTLAIVIGVGALVMNI